MSRLIVLAGRIAIQGQETTIDERALPGRQPRLVFAMLVMERHRPVSREELADSLWPEGRPATWDTALRGVVSRVRGFVGASELGGRELVQARAGTYRLHVDGVEVDLERAVAATGRAEAALAAGDTERAARLATQARAVLARPLLAGVEGPWVESRRRELTSQLLRALEVLAEARGRLGQHARVASAADAALQLDPFRESAHRALIRAALAAGDPVAGLRAYERLRTLLAEELGVDPSPETRALHLDLLRQTEPSGPPAVPDVAPEPSPVPQDAQDAPPYPGLRSFGERDAPWFFGRSADVSRLLDRLGATRFLAVLGASGSGKSSLVGAGLVPALRRGALPGSDTWPIQVLRPGAAPLQMLARRLIDLDPRSALDATIHRLEHDEHALHHLVDEAVEGGLDADRVLLVVDQLEEVFTQCSDVRRREAFLAALTTAVTTPGGRVLVVVTLRADFYPHLADHPRLSDLASSHQFLVTPMDEVGLGAAIEGPARAAGVTLEPGLTEAILRDVARRPGALPLLGQALLELWRHRAGSTLTLDGYHASGGVEGAVAQRAETVHAGLSADERSIAQRILLRLTQPGASAPDTRRRVAVSELVTRPTDRAAVERVVATLTAARLLTTDGPVRGEPNVEVSHEALIGAWPRLRDWIEEDRAGLLVHRRLTETAAEWEKLGREEGLLYRGVQLADAAAWAERNEASTNPLEREFLAASLDAQRIQRRGRIRRRRLTVAGLATGLLVTTSLAVFGLTQSDRLAGEARLSSARELAAGAVANLEVDPERSILLALEAVESTRQADGSVVREAEEALRRALMSSRLVRTVPQGGYGLAITSDGSRIVTTGPDPREHTATVWDLATGEEVLEIVGPETGRTTAVFSPDDRSVATTHDEGTVRLWDATSGEPIRSMRGHEGWSGYPSFSPDGRRLATGGEDRTVRVWDVATGDETLRLPGSGEGWTHGVFSPDGTRLAVSGDTDVALHDAATGASVGSLGGHTWHVRSVAFSRDGTHIATASGGTVQVWDADSETPLRSMPQPVAIEVVAFSPAGSWLATGGQDGTVRVWDVATGEQVRTLAGHASPVTSIAFTPDGDGLLTTAVDDTTRVWDIGVGGARDWLTVPGATDIFTGVAFSPDGAWFAAPIDPHGVTVWDARTGAEVTTLTGNEDKLTAVSFSPDGRRIVASSDLTLTLPVWDVASGELVMELTGHTDGVRAVGFSPDGDHIVTAGQDGTARLWDPATGRELDRIVAEGGLIAVGWSPDGEHLVTGGWEGAEVWDAHTLERVGQLRGHDGPVEGIAFGADGMLVTAGEDATARIWDLESGTELLTLRGHNAVVSGLAVSPDGSRLATASDDGTARLWDPTTGRELLTLVGHRDLVFGVAFSPDGRLLATASPDGTVALHLMPVGELVTAARDRVTRALTDDECRRHLHLQACPARPGP